MGETPLKVTSIDAAPKGFAQMFSKQVDVFGLKVYATANTPDAKVLHAANVLAQYIDNNADGQPDNALVLKMMMKHKAGMIMTATERDLERLDVHRHIPEKVWDNMGLQSLYGEETLPGGADRGEFDATLEEVLHLITQWGYANAYPDVFGEKPGTAVAKAMDKARGGHFRRVPRKYPDDGWFTYDDRTCDYACQITEYIYWGLTSILGAQDFPGRLEDISEEWRLNTVAKVKDGDPTLYKLLTDPQYAFPTKLPDGKYNPQKQNSIGTDSPAKARNTAEQEAPADTDKPRR
jgi:hypothetical protein